MTYSISSQLQLLKQNFCLPYISQVLCRYKLTKATLLTAYLIFLKRILTILNQLGHLTVIDQLKLLTAITKTISLQVASSGCQNTNQPYTTCATALKIAPIAIYYQERSLPPLSLELEFRSLDNMQSRSERHKNTRRSGSISRHKSTESLGIWYFNQLVNIRIKFNVFEEYCGTLRAQNSILLPRVA